MLNLFQQIYFLEDLALAEIVLHVILLYCLDRNLLAGELVDTKSDFAEGTLAYQFYELVEVERGWRELIVFLDVLFDVLYELVPLL